MLRGASPEGVIFKTEPQWGSQGETAGPRKGRCALKRNLLTAVRFSCAFPTGSDSFRILAGGALGAGAFVVLCPSFPRVRGGVRHPPGCAAVSLRFSCIALMLIKLFENGTSFVTFSPNGLTSTPRLASLPWLGPQAQHALGVVRTGVFDFFVMCLFIFIQSKMYVSLAFPVSSSLTHELFRIIFLIFQIFMDFFSGNFYLIS